MTLLTDQLDERDRDPGSRLFALVLFVRIFLAAFVRLLRKVGALLQLVRPPEALSEDSWLMMWRESVIFIVCLLLDIAVEFAGAQNGGRPLSTGMLKSAIVANASDVLTILLVVRPMAKWGRLPKRTESKDTSSRCEDSLNRKPEYNTFAQVKPELNRRRDNTVPCGGTSVRKRDEARRLYEQATIQQIGTSREHRVYKLKEARRLYKCVFQSHTLLNIVLNIVSLLSFSSQGVENRKCGTHAPDWRRTW